MSNSPFAVDDPPIEEKSALAETAEIDFASEKVLSHQTAAQHAMSLVGAGSQRTPSVRSTQTTNSSHNSILNEAWTANQDLPVASDVPFESEDASTTQTGPSEYRHRKTRNWIIDRHRRNLITVISKESSAVGNFLSAVAKNKPRPKPNDTENQVGSATDAAAHPDPDPDSDVAARQKGKDILDEKEMKDCKIVVSFAELQRMRLRKLQDLLVNDIVDLYLLGNESHEWEINLKEYIQTFRDYEYMTTVISDSNDDPFVADTKDRDVKMMLDCFREDMVKNHSEWPISSHSKLRQYREFTSVPAQNTNTKEGTTTSKNNVVNFSPIPKQVWQYLCYEPPPPPKESDQKVKKTKKGVKSKKKVIHTIRPIGGTRRANMRKSKLESWHGRLLMAAIGGFMLVGPMWLMVLHKTKYTSLITTTVLVFAFGILVARALEKPLDVLTSTAAYAAVLVVFVGTSTGSDSG